MSSLRTKLNSIAVLAIVASLLALPGFSTLASDYPDRSEQPEKPKKKDKKEKEPIPGSPEDIARASKELEAKDMRTKNISAQIEAEVAARNVPLPPEMGLDIDWYTPHINVEKEGRIIKGWVKNDLVLLETEKHHLIAVRREDGFEKWDCELSDNIRYAPAVSRNNVVVNVGNTLVAIEKNRGDVRWRLLPDFVMSCAPYVIDPAVYPRQYTKTWQPLESIFVGSWDGRFRAMYVRARMTYYMKQIRDTDDFSAPDFDLSYPWHKTHRERGVITAPLVFKENTFYYTADDHNVYAVSREGDEREPYFMLAQPVTGVTVTAPAAANTTNSAANSIYVGARDNYVYCLDRLTLKKKWSYAPGFPAVGNITADDPVTPFAYVATTDGQLHALQVVPARTPRGQPEIPETFTPAWDIKDAVGVVTMGPDVVYVGYRRAMEPKTPADKKKAEQEKEKEGAAKAVHGNGVMELDFPYYTGIAAVEKATGKVLWKSENSFFTSFIEFHNAFTAPTESARVFAVTNDNRLVSLKERIRDTGIQVIKVPVVQPEPTAPASKKPPAGDAAPGADAKPDAPKADAPKADAPKADAPKADAPKADDKK